jgi:hypothetical protein
VPPKNRSTEFGIGQVCRKPAELLSIFPTLIEVCELYDLVEDPNEWRNLADDESMKANISRLSAALP